MLALTSAAAAGPPAAVAALAALVALVGAAAAAAVAAAAAAAAVACCMGTIQHSNIQVRHEEERGKATDATDTLLWLKRLGCFRRRCRTAVAPL